MSSRTRPDPARQRSTALLAGVLAAVLQAAALLVWLTSDTAADEAPWGARWSPVMVGVGLVCGLLGVVVVAAAPRLRAAARWSAALLLSVVNGGVAAIALVALLAPAGGTGIGVGVMLAIAAFTTNLVAAQLGRAPVPATPAR